MNKVFQIIKHEFLTNLKRPSFLFSVFGVPIMMIVIFLIISLAESSGAVTFEQFGQIGFVDNSSNQVTADNAAAPDYPDLFQRYTDDENARAALDAGEIGGYLAIPENYMQTGQVEFFTYQDSPSDLNTAIEQFMLANLTANSDVPLPVERLRDTDDMTIQDVNDARNIASKDGVFFSLFIPVIFTFVLVMSSLTTGGFLMQGLVEERTNRVIEMLVTSVRPMQLLIGKMIGLGLLGLLQVVILLAAAVLILNFGGDLAFLEGVRISTNLIVLALVYYVLAYFLVAALMTAISVMTNSEREGRQISGFITIPFMIPYFAMFAFFADPNGTAAQILSYIPFTAPMAVLIRVGLTEVPLADILISMAIMVVTIVVLTWAAARIFRWGLLLYGKKFNVRELLRVIFGRHDTLPTTTPAVSTSMSS
jgi:ABC-2 type transport system permease protein